jgi:hypothetical protein
VKRLPRRLIQFYFCWRIGPWLSESFVVVRRDSRNCPTGVALILLFWSSAGRTSILHCDCSVRNHFRCRAHQLSVSDFFPDLLSF